MNKAILLALSFRQRAKWRHQKIRVSPFSYVASDCKFERNIYVDRFCILHKVSLRKYSYIGYGSAISDCSIGSFCSIAANVKIGLGIHPTDHISTSPLFYSDKNVFKEKWVEHNEMYIEQRKVIIENDVWIGTDAKIMGGVTIGNGAIVGAGAVVTHNVAPYAIVGGVPAKLIRHRFSESEIVAIEKSEWWNWPDERLFFGATSFRSYSSFANYLNELHAEGERT